MNGGGAMLEAAGRAAIVTTCACIMLSGCSRKAAEPPTTTLEDATAAQPAVPSPTAPRPQLTRMGMALYGPLKARFTGDLDGMEKRRVIRVLVVPTRTEYWIHDGRPLGIEYDRLHEFEKWLNKRRGLNSRRLHVYVAYIPTRRDDLIPALLDGRGDIAVGMLTETRERLKSVDFAGPFLTGVSELPVTGNKVPAFRSAEDLSGQQVVVRRSSSYWSHLVRLNRQLRLHGKAPVVLRAASERLTDDDLMEMVHSGLIHATVVDDYSASLWSQVLKGLRVQDKAAVNVGGRLGWYVRKNSPGLKSQIDAFAQDHGQGSLFGNSVIQKYTENPRFVARLFDDENMTRFRGTYAIFQKYAREYSLDPLLLVAQGFQESRLRQHARSDRGAIGIMQLMPETGEAMDVGDITRLDANVHAGAKYVRRLMDVYFSDPHMTQNNRTLFAFAAYNAGPMRIRRMQLLARKRGLDPNVWFNNVELVAAEQIGPETVSYVANIYKYYVAYALALHIDKRRQEAREEAVA